MGRLTRLDAAFRLLPLLLAHPIYGQYPLAQVIELAFACGGAMLVEAAEESPPPAPEARTLRAAVDRAKRRAVRSALRRHGGHRGKAAAELGVSVRTLWGLVRRYGEGK